MLVDASSVDTLADENPLCAQAIEEVTKYECIFFKNQLGIVFKIQPESRSIVVIGSTHFRNNNSTDSVGGGNNLLSNKDLEKGSIETNTESDSLIHGQHGTTADLGKADCDDPISKGDFTPPLSMCLLSQYFISQLRLIK